MTAADIDRFLIEHFPQAVGFCRITALGEDTIDVVVPYRDDYLRPGGTLSGPTLMTLADTAMYFLVLAQLGPIGLAVTTHLDINFLRKPPPADLHATARLLKLGKSLAIGEVHIRSADGTLVAQSSVTYSIPQS
ncbi:MAG TPA: PaaI family thioesterase [Kofleriaceae bacterium]|nr:PaaI family thioesterase [Kofleriaceae bacterium]